VWLQSGFRSLTFLAWFNVVLHIVGLVLAAVGMAPGSGLAMWGDRMDYLADGPVLWTLGWATWMVCAAALIAFLAAVTFHLQDRAGLPQFALMIAVVGAGFDLLCDSVYILVFPRVALGLDEQRALFVVMDRITGIASLVIANGAYSVAILLLTMALRAQPRLLPLTTATGFGVGMFGLVLAAAGVTGDARHAMLATPPTIGLFCIWVVLVARSLER
jgi:hypothetical protein